MAKDVAEVKLGVCTVTLNGDDLGHTKGGVVVRYAPEYHETTVDEYGESVVEKFLLKETFSAEVPLAQFNIANLKAAIAKGTEVNSAITIGSKAGKRASEEAGLLRLHPIANAANDTTEDVVIHKAVCTNEVELEHKNDSEKVIPVMFEGLIDESKADGNLLGYIGDSTS